MASATGNFLIKILFMTTLLKSPGFVGNLPPRKGRQCPQGGLNTNIPFLLFIYRNFTCTFCVSEQILFMEVNLMLDDLFFNSRIYLLDAPAGFNQNPFKWLRTESQHSASGDVGGMLPTVVDYSQDIYTLLMICGFIGAVLSLIFYLIVKYMLMAGNTTPRLKYERKEAVKQIFLWTIVLSLVVVLFSAIQKMAAAF